MRNDSSENDLRAIWQNQPTELSMMTVETMRRKTQELHAKTRQKLLRGIAVSLLVAGISAYGIASGNSLVVRAIFSLAIAWSMAGQYFVHRGMWSAALTEDAGLRTGIESYRREVERRRYLSGRFLLWSLGPVFLAVATLIALIVSFGTGNRGMALKGTLLNMTPFLTLLLIWLVGVFVVRIRDMRDLQREIDELDDIERRNI